MKRMNITINDPIYDELIAHSKQEDLTSSEIIRRALGDYFEALKMKGVAKTGPEMIYEKGVTYKRVD